MDLPTHTRNALFVQSKVEELGISTEIQQKIGVFAVAWGLFESRLEQVVWYLQNENVEAKRPSTDKTSAHAWVVVLENGSTDLSEGANEVLKFAAHAARDLMSYRHSLFHGHLVSIDKTAWFIRNPRWHGEVRNRETGDAHIDENIVDLAIDTAWALFRIVMAVIGLEDGNTTVSELEALKSEAQRAQSNASEVRHIAALMNHEKY